MILIFTVILIITFLAVPTLLTKDIYVNSIGPKKGDVLAKHLSINGLAVYSHTFTIFNKHLSRQLSEAFIVELFIDPGNCKQLTTSDSRFSHTF